MTKIYVEHETCPDPGRRMICDGGLALCTVCWGAEGSLATECPGEQMSDEHDEAVYGGELDFVDGAWVKSAPSTFATPFSAGGGAFSPPDDQFAPWQLDRLPPCDVLR